MNGRKAVYSGPGSRSIVLSKFFGGSFGFTFFSNPTVIRGRSSVGRAPALQAGGRRFESGRLHHLRSVTADLPFFPPGLIAQLVRARA
jgi:hypothetical protein